MNEQLLLREALAEERLGLQTGGLPIGSVLADAAGRIVARGHNLRVETGDPTAHAEVVCTRNAGRRRDGSDSAIGLGTGYLFPCLRWPREAVSHWQHVN